MYGVVAIKGHQYRVKSGDIIDVQKIEGNEGDTLELTDVLFIGGDKPVVGKPIVQGAKITATIVRQARERKKIVFVRKPGKYQKKNGHRQHYTCLKITELSDGQGNSQKA